MRELSKKEVNKLLTKKEQNQILRDIKDFRDSDSLPYNIRQVLKSKYFNVETGEIGKTIDLLKNTNLKIKRGKINVTKRNKTI